MNQKKKKSAVLRDALSHERLLRPLAHLEVAPAQLQAPLLKIIEALPLLIGDELHEALEEPHAAVHLERALSRRARLCCELAPHAPQRPRDGAQPKRPIERAESECLVLLSSQRRYLSPSAPRPKLALKEALTMARERFEEREGLKLILLATDAWDARLMSEQRASFERCLKERAQVLIPALHHGGLLTPICYL